VSVPDVIGFEVEQARLVLEAAGLRPGELDEVPNAADAGVIVATRPPTGATRPSGTRIGLVVSRGPADIRIPDVQGLELDEARRRLEAAGLRVGTVTSRVDRGRAGLVLLQRPGAGIMSPHEGRVDLVISKERP
jgi:serine/threonine-protein kinase